MPGHDRRSPAPTRLRGRRLAYQYRRFEEFARLWADRTRFFQGPHRRRHLPAVTQRGKVADRAGPLRCRSDRSAGHVGDAAIFGDRPRRQDVRTRRLRHEVGDHWRAPCARRDLGCRLQADCANPFSIRHRGGEHRRRRTLDAAARLSGGCLFHPRADRRQAGALAGRCDLVSPEGARLSRARVACAPAPTQSPRPIT